MYNVMPISELHNSLVVVVLLQAAPALCSRRLALLIWSSKFRPNRINTP